MTNCKSGVDSANKAEPTATTSSDDVTKPKPIIMAQRKFASFSSYCTYLKPRDNDFSTITELFPKFKPLTEDFLTFICFRGTNLLPPHLNFYALNGICEPKGSSVQNQSQPRNAVHESSNTGNNKSLPKNSNEPTTKKSSRKSAKFVEKKEKRSRESNISAQGISRRTLANRAKLKKVSALEEENKRTTPRCSHAMKCENSKSSKHENVTARSSAKSNFQLKTQTRSQNTRGKSLALNPAEVSDEISVHSPVGKKIRKTANVVNNIRPLQKASKAGESSSSNPSDRVLRSHRWLNDHEYELTSHETVSSSPKKKRNFFSNTASSAINEIKEGKKRFGLRNLDESKTKDSEPSITGKRVSHHSQKSLEKVKKVVEKVKPVLSRMVTRSAMQTREKSVKLTKENL